jgi:hypothetical protein
MRYFPVVPGCAIRVGGLLRIHAVSVLCSASHVIGISGAGYVCQDKMLEESQDQDTTMFSLLLSLFFFSFQGLFGAAYAAVGSVRKDTNQ